jgi:hypothetical protein
MRARQGGEAVCGVLVATAIVAAIALQVAGPRLQCRLADLVGITALAPSAVPAAAIAPSPSYPMHPCKVAFATRSGTAPVI